MKKYESKVLEILPNGDAVIDLPVELCTELNWNVGDQLKYSVEDGKIIFEKLDGPKSTN